MNVKYEYAVRAAATCLALSTLVICWAWMRRRASTLPECRHTRPLRTERRAKLLSMPLDSDSS